MFYHRSEAKHDSSEIQTDNMICLRWDLIQLLKCWLKFWLILDGSFWIWPLWLGKMSSGLSEH